MKNFKDLSEREILALAIFLEEEDERVYADFFEGLRHDYSASASVFDSMRKEETEHRRRLIELYRKKFGEHIPLIRRQDVKGFVQRKPVWLVRPLGLDVVRKQASAMEVETRRFYERAASLAKDASVRQLLDDLAQQERLHEDRAEELTEEKPSSRRKGRRGQGAPPSLCLADRATRLGRVDGRLSVNLGPGICGRVGHNEQLGRVSCRDGGILGRRHQYGVRRSVVR